MMWYFFFISARYIKNSEFANNAYGNSLYSDVDYTFPVLFSRQLFIRVYSCDHDFELKEFIGMLY
jgi:hypothetical protein